MKTSLGQVGKIVIFLTLVARNWLCADEGLQQRTEMMNRWQNQEETESVYFCAVAQSQCLVEDLN